MMKFGNHEPGIESIQVNGERIEAAEIMANKFNNYFTNIANSLAEKIKNPNLYPSKNACNFPLLVLFPLFLYSLRI